MFSLNCIWRLQCEHHLLILILLIFALEYSLLLSSGGTWTEGAAFARMAISYAVEYKQLTVCTMYSVQLCPNPVQVKICICKLLGLVGSVLGLWYSRFPKQTKQTKSTPSAQFMFYLWRRLTNNSRNLHVDLSHKRFHTQQIFHLPISLHFSKILRNFTYPAN
jgi:hypothetical protein